MSSVTKIWPYVVVVVDAEGRTHDYLFKARSRRHAEREARECVAQSEWATSLVRITPMVDYTRRRRRMLAVAAFAISGISMTWAMFIGLSLQGAF